MAPASLANFDGRIPKRHWAFHGEKLMAELQQFEATGEGSAFYVGSLTFTDKEKFQLLVRPKPSLKYGKSDPVFRELKRRHYALSSINCKSGECLFKKQINEELKKFVRDFYDEEELFQEQLDIKDEESAELQKIDEKIRRRSAFLLHPALSVEDDEITLTVNPKPILPNVIPRNDPLLRTLDTAEYELQSIDRINGVLIYAKRR